MQSFADFMRYALYDKTQGYYFSQAPKWGHAGDYTTAVEDSPLFAYCLANALSKVFKENPDAVILEIGGGSGRMAADLLTRLQLLNALPARYYLLEPSPALIALQQKTLQTAAPSLFAKIEWLTDWPKAPIIGVVLASEVLDALPVHRFLYRGGDVQEYFVIDDADKHVGRLKACVGQAGADSKAQWALGPCSTPLLEQSVLKIAHDFNWGSQTQFVSEVNLSLAPFLADIHRILAEGQVWLFDYGFARHEYYHASRNGGTLRAFYQHQVSGDVLARVGEQDLTADVDITLLEEEAHRLGWEKIMLESQAAFLFRHGILEFAKTVERDNSQDALRVNQQIKRLMLPGEMGERFFAAGFIV